MYLGSDSNNPPSENSATRVAYNRLRRMIVTGDLAPGTRLKIESLREALGVGASPIREALSLLTSDQLVVRLDQRGFRTADTSLENFEEILELRCTLEAKALRQSMEKATESYSEALIVAHHRMTRAEDQGREVFEQRHKEFHLALIGNCGSPLLLRFCDQLYDLNIRYRYIAGASSDYDGRNVSEEHQSILQATLGGDIKGARTQLIDHYRSTGAFLSKRIANATGSRAAPKQVFPDDEQV
ncbi:GntR family transcriptional regulator [uncultured Litoreibacter sp.]|uniref:GntR family transcriptional regulator n=1 Tax=uncultured Litoreibacter sp. TaxID=1392394 RepID=UPI0026206B52|nr:GntR family transcriptional regulator [uncultured Litoreibacter sp.]